MVDSYWCNRWQKFGELRIILLPSTKKEEGGKGYLIGSGKVFFLFQFCYDATDFRAGPTTDERAAWSGLAALPWKLINSLFIPTEASWSWIWIGRAKISHSMTQQPCSNWDKWFADSLLLGRMGWGPDESPSTELRVTCVKSGVQFMLAWREILFYFILIKKTTSSFASFSLWLIVKPSRLCIDSYTWYGYKLVLYAWWHSIHPLFGLIQAI